MKESAMKEAELIRVRCLLNAGFALMERGDGDAMSLIEMALQKVNELLENF